MAGKGLGTSVASQPNAATRGAPTVQDAACCVCTRSLNVRAPDPRRALQQITGLKHLLAQLGRVIGRQTCQVLPYDFCHCGRTVSAQHTGHPLGVEEGAAVPTHVEQHP